MFRWWPPRRRSRQAPDAPPLARPSPIPSEQLRSRRWQRFRRRLGGIFGAIIRGGAVGDDDHCDPRTMPRGGRRPTVTDIGIYGGGMGGARGIPIEAAGRPPIGRSILPSWGRGSRGVVRLRSGGAVSV